jgi:NAD(P)-dependent dehydrogenase (short-subunit alcohol dehydrogenase family)
LSASGHPGRLAGHRILVVGAGTRPSDDPEAPVGNGRAISVQAGREGAFVICADRDESAGSATAKWIEEEQGESLAVVADVTEEESCRSMVSQATQGRRLNGLVLNVGIARGRDLGSTSGEDWDLVQAVNLRGHFMVVREAMPVMAEDASIVFISSTAGLRPGSRIPAYDAAKAGIIGLCRHVALEGAGRGIRANVVAPGLIDTPIGRLASAARPSREKTPIPLGRQGTAWEVAATVTFLLSEEAGYITGQTLVVDGGLSLI